MFDSLKDQGIIVLIGLGLTSLLIYFLPTIVAALRGHHNTVSIFIVNFLLGWSFFGWVISLAWSLTQIPANTSESQVTITRGTPSGHATIILNVPKEAAVYLDGNKESAIGTVRTFVLPISAGVMSRRVEFRAELIEDQSVVAKEQVTLNLIDGDIANVNLTPKKSAAIILYERIGMLTGVLIGWYAIYALLTSLFLPAWPLSGTYLFAWYGSAGCQGSLATYYCVGGGGATKNLEVAAKWARRGADKRDPQSMFVLGQLHEVGVGDIRADINEAVSWYAKCVDQIPNEWGYMAVRRLIEIYGSAGSPFRDDKKAEYWRGKNVIPAGRDLDRRR